MKIYTKTGDKGHTQIYADTMVRMPKNANVLECYGTLDELNAQLGLLGSHIVSLEETAKLEQIQQILFQIGFAISATTKLVDSDITSLEKQIDEMQSKLPAQTSFILPTGCIAATQTHVCRTVARRAERSMVALLDEYPVPDICLRYLNRLSDYLFVFARWQNFQAGIEETKV
ncbi:MAG: cob(I)alamin adenosyltransferase [Paraglaciecola sp.]|jgi:cob(I)alamin adenosyltransferase